MARLETIISREVTLYETEVEALYQLINYLPKDIMVTDGRVTSDQADTLIQVFNTIHNGINNG